MPTLEWIGKSSVINHHREVPFRLLQCDPALSVGDSDSGNLLVQGDNLEALKALLPYYAGKVKCIYIDPPYNTGNENWVYNDNVNSPEIQAWLGKVVGGEMEDLSRHDKWLCMMYPRLALLREFLSEDGAVFVSIDDNEVSSLRQLMDEIFGANMWVCTLIWKRRQTPDSRNLNGVSADHEYVLCYSRQGNVRFRGQEKDLTKYKNPDNDPRGPWMSDNLTGLANAKERPNLHYVITNPHTGRTYPPHPTRGWIYGSEKIAELIRNDRILWPRSDTGRPRLKRFISDMKSETTGLSTLLDAPANVAGTKEINNILDGTKLFPFPKPSGLIELLLNQITTPNSIVLDSFAGSGTTAQAIFQLNKQDNGNRRFILIEMDENVCLTVTNVRLKRIIEGYGNQEPLGGGFRYCTLGEPLFDESGAIRKSVRFSELATHVFFTETGSPIPNEVSGNTPFLGLHGGKAVYLLFNGVLGDKRPQGGNVLTREILASLPPHNGLKVIYGEACRLGGNRLKLESIVFKQIPYDVQVR